MAVEFRVEKLILKSRKLVTDISSTHVLFYIVTYIEDIYFKAYHNTIQAALSMLVAYEGRTVLGCVMRMLLPRHLRKTQILMYIIYSK